jgi:hypothetical protein
MVEVELDQLKPIHDVPRKEMPAGHIDNLAAKLKAEGYNVANPVVAYEMPNGDLVLRAGHHRVEAMRRLGEKTIPTRIVRVGTGDPVGEAFILDIGKLTGKYESPYYPKLSPVERAKANDYVRDWRSKNGY